MNCLIYKAATLNYLMTILQSLSNLDTDKYYIEIKMRRRNNMIEVKELKRNCKTRVKGEVEDVLEQLLNATISIIMTLVERGNLDKEHINDFIDEFAQQVKII